MSKFRWIAYSAAFLLVAAFAFTTIYALPPFTQSVLSQSTDADATEPTGQRNFDPLNASEQDAVIAAALGEIDNSLAGADGRVEAAAVRRETLLVQRHEEPKNAYKNQSAPRRGDLYVYDYARDVLIQAVVNLDTGQTDEISESQGVQLPLTQNEIERALTFAYADNTLRTMIDAEFQAATGDQLYRLDQLEVRAFIFHASAMIGNVVPEAESCGINRCAQLLLYTTDDIAFELLPVVNLSKETVLPEARLTVASATTNEPAPRQASDSASEQVGVPAGALQAASAACTGDYLIDEMLPTTAGWQMCWSESPEAGIVLSDIYFTTATTITRKVMAQANLAQIHSVYDDNSARRHYVTDSGLGGTNLVALDASDCPSGTLLEHNGKAVLCMMIEPRGYIYNHDDDQRQGDKLRLFSVSQIGTQNFIVQWDFYDDGTIVPAVGNTGILSRYSSNAQYGWPLDSSGSTIGVGYVNNYYWRLDFDIGGNGDNDIVEEFNVIPTSLRTRKELTVTQVLTETGRTVDMNLKRSWRVRDAVIDNADNHKVSYHLEPIWVGNRYVGPTYEPWTNDDIYFTKDQPCEQYTSQNPATGGCGTDVTNFTDGESIDGADVVVWYRLSYHHLPRDEDELYIPVHWDSFVLIPRDWTAISPLEQ